MTAQLLLTHTRFVPIALTIVIISIVSAFAFNDALATSIPGTSTGSTGSGTFGGSTPSSSQTICNNDSATANIITAKIVHCIRSSLMELAVEFNDEIADFAEPILAAFLSLVIVFFGITILGGEGQPQRDGFILLFKIGVVYALFRGLGGLIPYIYLIMEEGIDIVTSVLAAPSGASGETCNVAAYTSTLDIPNIAVWAHIDCMLGFFFGFGENGIGDEILLASSIFGLIGASLGSGTFGIGLGFTILLTLLSFVFLIIRAVYGLLASYIYVTIMMIISPLVIPLLLGGQQLNGIFNRWLQGLGSAMLVPIFLFAYLALIVGILDSVIFATDGSASKIGSLAGIMQDENYKELWGTPQSPADCSNVNNPNHSAATGKSNNTDPDSERLRSEVNSMISGSANLCRAVTLYNLDPSPDLLNGANKEEVFYDIIEQLIKILIVIYVLSEGIQIVVFMAQNMMPGATYFIQSMITQSPAPENVIRGTLGGTQRGMQQAISGSRLNTLEQWQGVIRGGAGGTLQGLGTALRREF